MGSNKLYRLINLKIHSDFIKKIISVFSTKVLLLIVGLIASILSARILGPEGRGVFGVTVAVSGIGVQLGNLGMHTANTYYLAKDKERLPVIVGNSLALTGTVAVASMLIYLFFIIFPQLAPVSGIPLFLAFVLIPFQLYFMLQQNFFIALDKISQYNNLEILSGVLYPILLVVLALIGAVTPENALIASITGCVIVIITGFIWIRAMVSEKISINLQFFKLTLPFGLKTYLACLFSYLVIRADILMLKYFLGDEQTGLYVIAVSLADMVNMLSITVGMLLFPKASAISSNHKRYKFMRKTIFYMFIAMSFLIVLAILLSKYAIMTLYGFEYAPSVEVFNILMPGILCLSISSLLSNYFASKNMLKVNIITPIAALIVNIISNLILIPNYGIKGAAIASCIAYFMMFCIMVATFILDGRLVCMRRES